MPLFLLPFVILAARNTKTHKLQGDAAMMEAETNRARLQLEIQQFNAQHPQHKVITFTSPTPPWVKAKARAKNDKAPGTN
jgi:hypothetical protein